MLLQVQITYESILICFSEAEWECDLDSLASQTCSVESSTVYTAHHGKVSIT